MNKKQMREQKQQCSQESEPDDEKSEKSTGDIDTDNSPKVIPVGRLPEKLKTKKIVINISDTQYPILEEIAEQLGWVIQRNEGIGDWDVWWTDREITPDTLFRMNLYQKINHFPGIYVIARKNLLGLNLMAMRQKFPDEYSFFPETWIVPLEFPKLLSFYESCPENKTRTFIVKPEALSQGRGIFLTRSIDDIMNGNKYVVQRYIKNPFLIEDLKFDLRIYVLLAGTSPLRLYIYQEGLTRFATQKYQAPSDQNLKSSYIHLTNYSLNKNNPEYVYNSSAENLNIGHKRTLSSTYEYMAKKGHDVNKLKQQINQIIIKTVISGLPAISHQYQYCQPEQYEGNMCFHILGVDIMITSNLKPILIEINHTPSFETATPLDYKVKKNLIVDTLKLMRISSKNKKSLFERSKQIVKRRIETGKREIVKGEKRKQCIAEAQEKRDKEEASLFGGYSKIYPFEDMQKMALYNKMIERAEQVHKSSDEIRMKLIRGEQDKIKKAKKDAEIEQATIKQKKANSNPNNKPNIEINRNLERSTDNYEGCEANNSANYLKKSENEQEERRSQSGLNQREHVAMGKQAKEPPESDTKKNCNFRTKTKKFIQVHLYQTNHERDKKDELIRVTQFVANYLTNMTGSRKLPNEGMEASLMEADQQAFCNIKKIIEKKRRDSINVAKAEDKIKEGIYIVPKTYEIVDNKVSKGEVINLKQYKQKLCLNGSPVISEAQRLKALESYKSIYKKKRSSVY